VEESIRMTEDRDKWRKYVHGVANPRIKEGTGTGTGTLSPTMHLYSSHVFSSLSFHTCTLDSNFLCQLFIALNNMSITKETKKRKKREITQLCHRPN